MRFICLLLFYHFVSLYIGGLGALLASDDEPEQYEWGRLTELQRRNSLYPAHLKSSYPVEVQTRQVSEISETRLQSGTPISDGDPSSKDNGRPGSGRRAQKRRSGEGVPLDDSLGSCPGTAKRKVSLTLVCLPTSWYLARNIII